MGDRSASKPFSVEDPQFPVWMYKSPSILTDGESGDVNHIHNVGVEDCWSMGWKGCPL